MKSIKIFGMEFLYSLNKTCPLKETIESRSSFACSNRARSRLLTNVNVAKRLEEEMTKLMERMAADSNRAYALLCRQKNNGDIEEIERLQNKIEVYLPRILKQHNWIKAQELRTTLLQDILDRGGYKSTDKLLVNGTQTVTFIDNLSDFSTEELRKLAALDE